MIKRILLLASAALLCSFSYSKVTKESFEKAVDMLNCQSVFYSLSVLSPTEGVTAKFLGNCNCENSPAFEKIKSSIPKSEPTTIQISSEIQNLKTQDISDLSKKEVVGFLSKDVFEKSQLLSAFKNELTQNRKFSDYAEKLKQKLEDIIVGNVKVTNSAQKKTIDNQADLEQRILFLEKNQKLKEDNAGILGGLSDYLIILALILGILSILGILTMFLALRKRDTYETLLPKMLESKRLRDFVQSQNALKRDSLNNNSSPIEIRDLKSQIRELENRIINLNNKIQNLFESSPKEPIPLKHQEIRQPELKSETLFLSTPNSDGSFNESSASSSYKDGASIYRLTKIGSVNSEFQIDEKETSIKLALQYPDKNIDPVCDAENAFNPRANRISTIKMGEAELQNGRWIIKSKAVIRYED